MIHALLVSAALGADASPHFSYPKLVTANGYGVAVFASDRFSEAWPHLYQAYDPDTWTPEVLYDTYWGWVGTGGGGWWNGSAATGYEPGTNVVRAERAEGPTGVRMVEYTFAPMDAGRFALAQVGCVENVSGADSAPFALVSLHNWHVGGTEVTNAASATEVREAGSEVSLAYQAPGAAGYACSGLYDSVIAGYRPSGSCDTSGGDVVPGFVWDVPALAPGERWCAGVYTSSAAGDGWIAGRPATDWVPDEVAWWDAWQARAATPPMSEAEERVYRQALAFLKMAQVREEGSPYGQIPASLPASAPVGEFQHIWNITWVRDGAYAAAALTRAGYTDEAADSLRFLIQPGMTGEFRAYVGDADYAVSVCRVYGNGLEWSDTDANGPNVEFDNFGLFLWALGQLHEAGRLDVVEELGPRALDGVADVLVRLVDPNTGLLLPDSSIWERHWNGNQQQFTYSSAWAVAGLRAAADMADALGDERAGLYRETADGIARAIPAELIDASGVVAASREQLESGSNYLDLAAVEVFNLGILPPDGTYFDASYEAWNRGLAVASGHGYKRNDDGDVYDEHEWIVMDLRLAEALRAGGREADAEALVTWLTDQAVLNHDTLPELMNPDTADYAGPAPMLGFGSGAYAYYLLGRDGTDDPGDDTGDDPADDTGDDTDGGADVATSAGCGCASSPSPSLLAALVAAGALIRRRRP